VRAGALALDNDARRALRAYGDSRTYSQDIHTTIVDLLGAYDARRSFPFANLATGRSLLRAPRPFTALLSTETSVWEPDDPQYGAMSDSQLLTGSASSAWRCYDLASDPGEHHPLPASACALLQPVAEGAFPKVPK
jgi:hypothetical protein